MAHNATRQLAQELLIHIIEFLGDSFADLRACALVSRSFVHAAQSQIFQEISFGFGAASVFEADRRSNRLLETLHAAPHLAQHVRWLCLLTSTISGSTLSDICGCPFPGLQAVFCYKLILYPVAANALRQLLALPTLHIYRPYPFDLSGLVGLSVSIHAEVVRWPKIAPILQNITVFTFIAHPDMDVTDLSAFGSLEYLRIELVSLAAWPNARAALSTIAPSNNIRKIVLLGKFFAVDGDELDRTLTRLPLHYAQVVDFVMQPEYYDRTIASLSSTNDIRRTDDDFHWFERMTGALR
ncbi:hypothetical protein B0H15DRAFT_1022636 [Mycena belliarum]|uniref:F-box domain-containing protein n=1 Tax=Mycena belliarum TaxID=1033014 RepID=A0AAD6U392_9AGAR|nr:hypothetical protein B0H15DRAFT_1022636 [Mycena belliae]